MEIVNRINRLMQGASAPRTEQELIDQFRAPPADPLSFSFRTEGAGDLPSMPGQQMSSSARYAMNELERHQSRALQERQAALEAMMAGAQIDEQQRQIGRGRQPTTFQSIVQGMAQNLPYVGEAFGQSLVGPSSDQRRVQAALAGGQPSADIGPTGMRNPGSAASFNPLSFLGRTFVGTPFG